MTACDYGCPHSGCQHEMRQLARAQVHATLALAAATALPGEHPGDWQRRSGRSAAGRFRPGWPAIREIEPGLAPGGRP